MNTRIFPSILLLAGAAMLGGQTLPAPTAPADKPFDNAAATVKKQLEDSLAELSKLREQVVAEKVPLSRRLNDLESDLVKVRLEYQQTVRLLDSRTLDLANLRNEIKARNDEAGYLSNLLSEYLRNFESGLHIVEMQRYRKPMETARLARENTNLSEQEVYQAQASLVALSLDRLDESLGGARFEGTAVDKSGAVKQGAFVLMGPAALFQSADHQVVGTAETRLGSLEPAVIPFENPQDAATAGALVTAGKGEFPLDPTLGNAHKVEATQETLLEHIKKGGPVMYPIFVLAGAGLLVVLYKWLALTLVRTPSRKRLQALLDAVSKRDTQAVNLAMKKIRGPIGRMLAAGVEHLGEPTELIEEVMYEKVMAARLKFNRFLPFVAICASSAPLLGLLGTVTGIMNTFSLMTVFGTGDVKTLSSGISEALITTEYGLIVAIPSLLLHAFLARKARGLSDQMEKAAVAFINQVNITNNRPLEKAA